jgi:hypothetical protein
MKIFQTCADYLLERGVDVMLGFMGDANMPRSGMIWVPEPQFEIHVTCH